MRVRSWWVVLLAVLATLGAAPSASAGPGVADRPARGANPLALTVLTWNIHHGVGIDGRLDLERIARVIEQARPDVVALQEVDVHWGERSGDVDQAAWLGRRLGMHAVFGANLDLDPVTPGSPRRQFGTAVLSRSRIVSWRNTPLPLAPGGEQRGLLDVQVRTPLGRVRVLDTHLQHTSSAERLDQVAAVRSLTAGCRQPSVLMGDLNAEPDSPEMQQLTRDFRDVWPRVGDGDGFTFDADAPRGRIDYVLTRNVVLPRRAAVLDSLASDHLPVRAELLVAPWPLQDC